MQICNGCNIKEYCKKGEIEIDLLNSSKCQLFEKIKEEMRVNETFPKFYKSKNHYEFWKKIDAKNSIYVSNIFDKLMIKRIATIEVPSDSYNVKECSEMDFMKASTEVHIKIEGL